MRLYTGFIMDGHKCQCLCVGIHTSCPNDYDIYSVSPSSGSDFLSACTHSLFLRAPEPVCAISLDVRDLALRWANKRITSLPEDSDTKYSSYCLQILADKVYREYISSMSTKITLFSMLAVHACLRTNVRPKCNAPFSLLLSST